MRYKHTGMHCEATRLDRKDPPCTRQSLLTLATFRSWGIRRINATRRATDSVAETGAISKSRMIPLSYSAEDSPSGLWRTPGTRVGLTPSGVQIPYPPRCEVSGHHSLDVPRLLLCAVDVSGHRPPLHASPQLPTTSRRFAHGGWWVTGPF